MSFSSRLGPFRGLMTALGGDAPAGFSGDLLNVRLGDGRIRPRFGYRNLAAKPGGLAGVFGLARVSGYDASTHKLEWVTVEDRSGTIKPYAVDPVSWARTEITDGDSALDLEDGEWSAFSFDGNSYWINPSAEKSAYRHEVGTDTSWTALADIAYVPPVEDPDLLLSLNSPYARPYDVGTDTIAVSGAGVSGASSAVDTDGNIVVSGDAGNNTQDSADSIVTVTFASAQDFSTTDYQAFLATGGLVYVRFKEGGKLEVKISGVWQTPPQKAFLNPDDRTKTGVVVRMKGFAGANAVQAVRMTVRAEPQPHKSGVAYTLSGYTFGGSYLGATVVTDRPWDASYQTADITYAVRYRDVSAGTVTGIKQVTYDESRFGTFDLDHVLPGSTMGDRVSLEIGPLTTGGYSDDPAGTSYQIEYLRMDQDGVWHILGTKPNTGGQSWRDGLEEVALQALSAASPAVTGYTAPELAPVFSTGRLKGGFAYHGCVVWLYDQGKANIRYSRVGEAENLANPSDDVNDMARGADFTMADDFADAPLGGVQAGDAAIILGREGCYAQAGKLPAEMTPPRKIPGSAGGAGRFAFTRYVDKGGSPGMAWYDAAGENVWFAVAGLVYSGDSQARPIELSAPIRGSLRRFLYTEQLETIDGLALSQARMDFDAATGALWLVLGQRAAVFRAPSPMDGRQEWEFLEFALGTAVADVDVCSDPFGPSSGVDQARSGATLAWTDPGNAVVGAGVASSGGYAPGLKSHWLKGSVFVPNVLLPAEATLTALTLRIRHRSPLVSDVQCPVQLAAIDAYNGATLKYSAVGGVVPTAWQDYDVELPLGDMDTDVSGVNAGDLSARIAYDAVPSDPDAFDPSNWSVVVSPSGSLSTAPSIGSASISQTFTVTATYIGGGSAPTYVPLSLTGTASVLAFHADSGSEEPGGGGGGTQDSAGTAVLNDGLGGVFSGGFVGDQEQVSTRKRMVAVSAGVATTTVAVAASVSATLADTVEATVALTASVVSPDTPHVEVESLALIACYTVPMAEGERSISFLAFGPDRNLIWLRSSGHLDAVEWCPTCQTYIDGTSRDGGLPMPEGYWESARLPGALRRLTRVDVERSGFVSVGLSSITERSSVSAIAPEGRRWARFPGSASGMTHRIRVVVPESLAGVDSLEMVFSRMDGPGR